MKFLYASIIVPFAQIGFELILNCSTQSYLRCFFWSPIAIIVFALLYLA